MTLTVTLRQFNTIQAALRLYQAVKEKGCLPDAQQMAWIDSIAEDGNDDGSGNPIYKKPLDIDALCERMNRIADVS